MKKIIRILGTFILTLVMFFSLSNITYAEEPANVAWIGDDGYPTLDAAIEAANDGDTIQLGEGIFSTYHPNNEKKYSKTLTFIGSGTGKTTWQIGPEDPNPDFYGTEYNGDYTFDNRGNSKKETVTFKNMTLQSGTVDYLGFIGIDNTVVENCEINGKTFYWGYNSATFKNTTFNAPKGDYAIWTYCSPTMTFDGCIFNTSGKTINVYTDYSAGSHDINIIYKNCNVVSSNSNKCVMNINDSNMKDYKYIINISGKNTVNGIEANSVTCSRLFGFNISRGGNSGRTTVNIDGKNVWNNGKMVSHAIDTENDKYTDGYKDDAFTVTYSEWEKQSDGTYSRKRTSVCKYCGYKETTEEIESKYVVSYDLQGGTSQESTVSKEYFSNETVTVIKNPTKEGYTFIGWQIDVDDKDASVTYNEDNCTFVMPKANVKFTAKWEKNKIEVKEDPTQSQQIKKDNDKEAGVKTGDATQAETYILLIGLSLMIIILLYIQKKIQVK